MLLFLNFNSRKAKFVY